MTKIAKLRGMTWNHSRGLDPMIATSRRYSEINPGVEIGWEQRSLQAFADYPIRELTSDYDLVVIDHPHLGEVARDESLVALDTVGRSSELADLEKHSVGLSHQSYNFQGRQWALAIDAATPVASCREDVVPDPPSRWNDVVELARRQKVAFALIPINALMTFMGLARNLGHEIAVGECLVDPVAGRLVLDMMKEIQLLMEPRCLDLDPIGVLDWMASEVDGPVYIPFGYGYTNYSRAGYCRYPVTFVDAPGFDDNGPGGTVLGGAGISVSSRSPYREIAVDFAFWIAGAEIQQGLYFESGGQPGHAVAWESDDCNRATRDFFRNTRRTLETAWLRPRYPGYMRFQDQGGDIVHAFLRNDLDVGSALEQLQEAYQESCEVWP